MSSNHTAPQQHAAPPNADDLKLIHGIGPGIAQRLYDAGILSFAQLAELSPDEIAARIGGVAGLSGKSVAAQNWVEQARALAGEETPAKAERQHYATFTVQLLLDEANAVRRTQVTHVQSGAADTWANWQADRLTGFFIQRGELHLASIEAAASLEAEIAPQIPTAEHPRPTLRLRSLDLTASERDGPRQFLRCSQGYVVRLALELSGLAPDDAGGWSYSAAVYAKSLGGRARHDVGEAHGAIAKEGELQIDMQGNALPGGIYRLEALANAARSGAGAPETLTAFLEAGLLQVY